MAKEKQYRFKSDEGMNATLLIGVLLIAVLLVGGGLLYIITQKKGAEPVVPVLPNLTNQTQPNLTNQTPVVPCDAACAYRNAVASRNPAFCANLSAQFVQPCYEALSNVSLEACKAVADAAKKQSCVTASAMANISICDLAGNRSACRHAVDPCADASDKVLCNALAKSDPSLCRSDTWCLFNYSAAKTNSSACSLIQNPVVSAACVSAIKRQDKCSDFPLQSQKDYCYQLYAMYTDDYLVCTQIYPDSSYGLDCLSRFAAKMHNYSICKQDALSLNTLWACYTNYSLLSGDLSGCYQIDKLATTSLFHCAFEYAKKFGDPTACELITETLTMRSTCYQGTMIYSNSNLKWQNCAGITNFEWKNKCYTESAKLYNDPSLCDYATEEFARQSCRSSYAANKTG
ncbi:MAG: hypothetical protein PHV13_01730 [Candidatus ainarchaeum sp.]|nr:hypothetical protein [Candidatus ainarchaeum sp.]